MLLNCGFGEDSWESLGLRSNQSILKEISSEYSLEGLKLKLQYFGHLIWRADPFEKTDAGKDWRQQEKRMTEDEMVGWHHWLRHEFEKALRVGDGQGSLACCSPWGHKESETTERLNWTEQTLDTSSLRSSPSELRDCLPGLKSTERLLYKTNSQLLNCTFFVSVDTRFHPK